MLRCLLDAMENYEDTEEEIERLHDKLHDNIPNKVPNKLKQQYPGLSDAVWDVYLELKEDAYASAETIGSRLGICFSRDHWQSFRHQWQNGSQAYLHSS